MSLGQDFWTLYGTPLGPRADPVLDFRNTTLASLSIGSGSSKETDRGSGLISFVHPPKSSFCVVSMYNSIPDVLHSNLSDCLLLSSLVRDPRVSYDLCRLLLSCSLLALTISDAFSYMLSSSVSNARWLWTPWCFPKSSSSSISSSCLKHCIKFDMVKIPP